VTEDNNSPHVLSLRVGNQHGFKRIETFRLNYEKRGVMGKGSRDEEHVVM